MPTLAQAYERLKYEVEHGKGEERVHVVYVEREQAERIKNDKRKTRLVIETHDADLLSEFESEKDRIMRRCNKNVSIFLTLLLRAMREALADGEIDRILAEETSVEEIT